MEGRFQSVPSEVHSSSSSHHASLSLFRHRSVQHSSSTAEFRLQSGEVPSMRGTKLNAEVQAPSSWLPTRLTSPYCVLSAAGVQEDFYTTCLSWGVDQMALALSKKLVMFHPLHPLQTSSMVEISGRPCGESIDSSGSPDMDRNTLFSERHCTCVAVPCFNDNACFLGLSNGELELYSARGDGTLDLTTTFDMPNPPTAYLEGLMKCRAGSRSRAVRAMDQLKSSVSSIGSIATSCIHPWLAAAGTAARGLLTLDARQQLPAQRFGSEASFELERQETWHEAGAAVNTLPGSPASRMKKVASFLLHNDRLCSVAWNSNGSLIATGSGSGVVLIWSLCAPQRPLHSFLVDHDCSVKALSFHPTNPYELVVGAKAGSAGIRTYDISSSEPVISGIGCTTATVLQALYAPDGNCLVTSHGANLSAELLEGDGASHGQWSPSTTSATALTSLLDSLGDAEGPGVISQRSGAFATRDTGSRNHFKSFPDAACSTTPNTLVVWRRGLQSREHLLREALLSDEPSCFPTTSERCSNSAANLIPMYSLPGHRSRPLCLSTPSRLSPFAGCAASIAASSSDSTIRFWRLFESSPSAENRPPRHQAYQQSTPITEAWDTFATPTLR